MMHFEDFENHGFWSVAARAWRKDMILISYEEIEIFLLIRKLDDNLNKV